MKGWWDKLPQWAQEWVGIVALLGVLVWMSWRDGL